MQSKDETEDVSNAEPSVKEASSRFGVNLRRRSPKIDSTGQISPPEEAPPPPPPPLSDDFDMSNIEESGAFESKPGMKEMLELKLINEIKQSCDQKSNAKRNNVANNLSSGPAMDPASQLLSELCATFTLEPRKNIFIFSFPTIVNTNFS